MLIYPPPSSRSLMANDDDHDFWKSLFYAVSTPLHYGSFSQVNTYNYHQILRKNPSNPSIPHNVKGSAGKVRIDIIKIYNP